MKKTGERLGLSVAAFGLIVALLAFFSIGRGYAWMSTNRTSGVNGLTLKTAGGAPVSAAMASYGVLSISSTSAGGTYVTENVVEGGVRRERHELPIDDPNNIFAIDYERALVLVLTLRNVSPDPQRVAVECIAATDALMMQNELGETVYETNYLSNAITLAPATSSDGVSVTKGADLHAFVTFDGDGNPIKQNSLTLFDQQMAPGETQTLYFIMEYNHPFLDYLNPQLLAAGYYKEVTYIDDLEIRVS